MAELIPLPGLHFLIFKLDGKLKYTFTRDGKPAKEFEITDIDIEFPAELNASDEQPEPGANVSADGILLRILKNPGALKMEYVGKNGMEATWLFKGLEATVDTRHAAVQTERFDARPLYFSAETQTVITIEPKIWESIHPQQDKNVGVRSIQFEPVTSWKQNSLESSRPQAIITEESRALNSIQPQQSNDLGSRSVSFEPVQSLNLDIWKNLRPPQSLHKLTKNWSDSPWPTHIYLNCDRTFPRMHCSNIKGLNRLEINLQKWTVRYGSRLEQSGQLAEQKEINLSSPSLFVSCRPVRGEVWQYALSITRSSVDKSQDVFEALFAFTPQCLYGKNKIISELGLAPDDVTLNDPMILVEALVHCIDRTSGRTPNFIPDINPKLNPKDFKNQKIRGFMSFCEISSNVLQEFRGK